jgi:hypothetical protein
MSEVFGEGEWLPASEYYTYYRVSKILDPSDTWLLLDEAPGSINDAAFAVQMVSLGALASPLSVTEIDHPGGYHGGSCGISFSDGHSIVHHWFSPLTYTAVETSPGQNAGQTSSADPSFKADMVWLTSVTTKHK